MAVENGPTEYDLGRAAPMRCTLPPAAPLRAAGLSGVLDSSDITRVVSGRPARISLRSRRDALDCCFPQPSERARRLAQHYRSGRLRGAGADDAVTPAKPGVSDRVASLHRVRVGLVRFDTLDREDSRACSRGKAVARAPTVRRNSAAHPSWAVPLASCRTGSRPAPGCPRGGDPVRDPKVRRRAPNSRNGG